MTMNESTESIESLLSQKWTELESVLYEYEYRYIFGNLEP